MKIRSSYQRRPPSRRMLRPRESSRALRKSAIEIHSTLTVSDRHLGLTHYGCPMRSTLSSAKWPPKEGHIRFGSSIAFCTTTSNESGVCRRRTRLDGKVLAGEASERICRNAMRRHNGSETHGIAFTKYHPGGKTGDGLGFGPRAAGVCRAPWHTTVELFYLMTSAANPNLYYTEFIAERTGRRAAEMASSIGQYGSRAALRGQGYAPGKVSRFND